ncbi:hypothetical protein [Streptomyces sp. NPDC055105]|uniref:hypothetical protein n=1 Tax=Streptomyces sp. NPDC055105 TaxID=3365719 RepID=UPI0037D3AAA6
MDAQRLLARLGQVFVAATLTFSSAAAAIPASAAPRPTTVGIARYPHNDDPGPSDFLFRSYNKGYQDGYQAGFRKGYEGGCNQPNMVQGPRTPQNKPEVYKEGFLRGYYKGILDGWNKIRLLCFMKTHPKQLPPVER